MTAAIFAGSRRWPRRLVIIAMVIAVAVFGLSRSDLVQAMRGPSTPFDPKAVPPAPDYSQRKAWMALPDSHGLEQSAPVGVTPIDPATAAADVFFIRPTTYKGSPIWNAPYDAGDDTATLNPPVLLEQASVFNGCCRIYAPHYRQATLKGLDNPPAYDLAYGDVRSAFRYFIAHHNSGRPFIIAAHSQGTGHALRLLQEEVIGTPLQARLIVAYLIGGYAPTDFARIGLPICDTATQTNCIVSYNTSQRGRTGAHLITIPKHYWWQGKVKVGDPAPAICVNPLNWREQGAAPASDNAGSVPFPKPPFKAGPQPLPLVPHLTGAACKDGLLEVDIGWSAPAGFRDMLSLLYGSFHLSDYGIFYSALRQNAADRVTAWEAARRLAKVRPTNGASGSPGSRDSQS